MIFNQIAIYTGNTSTMFPRFLKDWLVELEEVKAVDIYTIGNNENVAISDEFCIIIREQSTVDATLSFVEHVRRNGLKNKVLIIDFASISVDQVKQFIAYKDCGVVNAWISIKELWSSMCDLMERDWLLSFDILNQVLSSLTIEATEPKPAMSSADYENGLIEAAREGLSIKETAAKMGLSANTIAVYRSKLLKKYGVNSMKKLVLTKGK